VCYSIIRTFSKSISPSANMYEFTNTNSLLNQFVSYDFAQSLLNQSLFQVFVEYLLLFLISGI
jgi:hypothetical protein